MTRWARGAPFLALLVALLVSTLAAPDPRKASLEHYIEGRAASGFSGAVLVSKGAEALVREAFGFSDVELGVRNTPGTLFRIGSVTKPLVATTALRLVARGQLGLVDPLVKYLPETPVAWREVRVVDLLSHTSGIPDLFGEVAAGPPGRLREVIDDTLKRFVDSDLKSYPGSHYAYSNFGYLLLACVIEAAGGRPWMEMVQREVISPAGMTDTRYDDVWEIVPGRARGYRRERHVLINTEYKDHGAFAAGGLLSTVDDLQRFTIALDGGGLISSSLRERMLTPVQDSYGLGWQVTRFFDRAVIDHTGGIGGFTSHIAWYPDERLFVAVLSNVEDEPLKAMACDMAALALEAGPTVLDREAVPAPEVPSLDLLTGTYAGDDGQERSIARVQAHLELHSGPASYAMTPVGPRHFSVEGIPGVILEFEGPAAGAAVVLTARMCGSSLFVAHRAATPD